MKKIFNTLKNLLLVAFVPVFVVACNQEQEHQHIWGKWHHDATHHWRYCVNTGCTSPRAQEIGEHVGYPCEICGPTFKAIAFYTGVNDQAHVSFCKEANKWFPEIAKTHNFTYDSTTNWDNMNDDFLSDYDLILFFDTRPEKPEQREAFERFMEDGGAWIGFHFAAFALTPSDYPNDWEWYHDEFLGSGEYVSNTWEPTTAILQVETHDFPGTENIPDKFEATACDWYRWEHDLRENPDIEILCSIHPDSFPLGTGPKEYEIWHSGYYPVVWTNTNYKMMYMNMGHNRMNYSTDETLSYTFSSDIQNTLLLDTMFGFFD